ncbi:23S rRNA (uracil(1939)-C(5))-methyltransferase RlmD [Candidatus Uhrbacteria bacterium]|nr:23S rRNA (uracil(1939)-C(5))-methyltransferase RlmD [Candidatus Uhrbacteria bacterium]
MRFGHRLHGKIEGYDDKGRGFMTLDAAAAPKPHREYDGPGYMMGSGKVVIPFTAKGDEVTAVFQKRDHGTKVAKIESVNVESPDRTEAPCPHAGTCGGCLWQHLKYDAQLILKRDMINRAFEGAGHKERVDDVMPSPIQFHHRNRMDYAIGWNGEIGLKEHDSWNRYVDLQTCLLLAEGVGEILQAVREWMQANDLQPWDAKFHHGDIRYVVFRDGKNTNQRMLIVVVKDATRITEEMRSSLLNVLDLRCTTLLLGEQHSITDLSYAQTFYPLKGDVYLEEVVNDVRYRIHPNSFFQTNTTMAAVLQNAVLDLIDTNTKHVLDLYCGLGFFGIALAKRFPELQVHGHELDAEAITLAEFNAKKNGVAERTSFTAGPSEDLSWAEREADLIILDPPRAGLHPKVIKTLLTKLPERIIYISCNYKRFVEELKLLQGAYRIKTLQAFDLFPHSPHVEVVISLEKVIQTSDDLQNGLAALPLEAMASVLQNQKAPKDH